ncbi:MAG: hypothetical protein U9O87_02815 [Verrucomicrobiota bacterium]|nr:hypothetical protein [Verrucomicrobiota bacterium]
MEKEHFKICPSCKYVWENREDFLNDNNLSITGYQVHFEELTTGLFLFNHSCGTTLAIEASAFFDMYDGIIFKERMTGKDNCPQYCLTKDNLKPCKEKCECAFVREILQKIKKCMLR